MNEDQEAYLENMRKALGHLKLAEAALIRCNADGEQFDFANSSDTLIDWIGETYRRMKFIWYQERKKL